MIYGCIFLFLFSTIISLEKNKSVTIFIYSTSILFIALLAILVGINSNRADYENYLSYFQRTPPVWDSAFNAFTKTVHTEIGYNILQGLFKGLINSASFYFIVFCLISLCFRYKFYKYFVSLEDLGIVFLAFFSHEFLRKDCVQIRNGFASAIVLYSFIHLYKGNKFKFVLTVLLASCFQMTAIVALPLIIAKDKNNRKYWLFLNLLFWVALVFSIIFKIKNILYLFEKLGVLPHQILNYLYWSQYSKSMPLTNPMLLKQILITGYFFIFKKDLLNSDSKVFFLFQMYLVSTVYYLVFRDFEILAGRFGSLFYGVEAPLLVLASNKSKKNILQKKIFITGMYLGFFMLNVITNPFLSFTAEWH